jgi:hypothetical protein
MRRGCLIIFHMTATDCADVVDSLVRQTRRDCGSHTAEMQGEIDKQP